MTQGNDLRSVLALLERLRHAFDYMEPVDSDYARQEVRDIADRLTALLHGGGGEAVGVKIRKVLRDYRCQYQQVEEGEALPLVDALTPNGDSSILRGEQEIELLADAIWAELQFTTPPPQPRGDMVLVPREPTEFMLWAASQADDDAFSHGAMHGAENDAIYRAMLAAAPGEVSGKRPCTCHPDDRPAVCQRKYAASECIAADTPPPASQSTDPRAQFDSSGKLIAYDARGGGMYGPFPASQSAPSAGGGELPEIEALLDKLGDACGKTYFFNVTQSHPPGVEWLPLVKPIRRELMAAIRRLATAGQGVPKDSIRRMVGFIFRHFGSPAMAGELSEEMVADTRSVESWLAAPTPEQRG